MKIIIFSLTFILATTSLIAQVGIGTVTPHVSAMLDLNAATQGLLPPRLSTAERDAIVSPAVGLTIHNSTTNCLNFFTGLGWNESCGTSLALKPISNCLTSGFIAPFLTANETAIVPVTNPDTGKTWMDRNLGAVTAARASNDCYAYGNLYQWGRGSDGHEFRNSPKTSGQVASNYSNNDLRMHAYDWLSTQNDLRWDTNGDAAGGKTLNDPCPDGYRVPTEAELNAERLTWGTNNSAGALASPLKLQMAGYRIITHNFSVRVVGTQGLYWSGTVHDNTRARHLLFKSNEGASMHFDPRASAFSVRCIKD